jgi:hypothetical protein
MENGESGKDLGHPTTDSALTIPRIAWRGALDLKDWLKWDHARASVRSLAKGRFVGGNVLKMLQTT